MTYEIRNRRRIRISFIDSACYIILTTEKHIQSYNKSIQQLFQRLQCIVNFNALPIMCMFGHKCSDIHKIIIIFSFIFLFFYCGGVKSEWSALTDENQYFIQTEQREGRVHLQTTNEK